MSVIEEINETLKAIYKDLTGEDIVFPEDDDDEEEEVLPR